MPHHLHTQHLHALSISISTDQVRFTPNPGYEVYGGKDNMVMVNTDYRISDNNFVICNFVMGTNISIYTNRVGYQP